LSAPVIAATRLRQGSTNSVRGAAKLLADALATTRRAGATGLLIVRADYAEVLVMPRLVVERRRSVSDLTHLNTPCVAGSSLTLGGCG
jgi:hypothetical protein